MRLRNPDNKIQEEGQTQLISTPVTAVATDNSNCQKNQSSANGNIYDAKKPAVPGVVAVPDKKSNENVGKSTETLIPHEPIHYRMLPPNEPHPCDKYGWPREAKYKLDNSYFCDDKTISHFREIARTCKDEGFELIEDLQQLEDSSLEDELLSEARKTAGQKTLIWVVFLVQTSNFLWIASAVCRLCFVSACWQ